MDPAPDPGDTVAQMSRRPDLLATFRALPIFAACTDEELAEIDSVADELTVSAGRALIRQGEVGREFIVIIESTVTVVRDGAVVATLGPGSYFGELALLDEHPRNATVTAETDLRIQVIDRRAFQTLLDDSPHLTKNLLKATARRVHQLDDENAALRARLGESALSGLED